MIKRDSDLVSSESYGKDNDPGIIITISLIPPAEGLRHCLARKKDMK